ncbi:MAG TPA: hypothetical protein VFA24_08570 [Gaiellaceae bacterium]|nr:hypothetical protein [Gaiellaceae bacterium]
MDWVAISSLATAGGTLSLAATTYLSVRSANQAARTAERSLLAGLRPLLVESLESDPVQRVNFFDLRGVVTPGGGAAVQVIDGSLYVVLSLRNVGPGIAVLYGGTLYADRRTSRVESDPLDTFRMLGRDIYIPPGKVGFWQIAYRGSEGNAPGRLMAAIEAGEFMAEVLYGDYEGGQRVVTRYAVIRDDDGEWQLSTVLHNQVDRDEPR